MLNIVSLGMHVWFRTGPPPHLGNPPHKVATQFLVKELSLDQDQRKELRPVLKAHFDRYKALHNEIRQHNQQLVKIITADQLDSTQLELTSTTIAQKQKEISLLVKQHYEELQDLCRPDQQKQLQAVFQEMLINNRRPGLPGR